MNTASPPVSRPWTLLAVAAVALALSGCGRKGPLDLPPNAAAPVAQQEVTEESRGVRGNVLDTSQGSELPATPKGGKRGFILDPLLNSN